MIPKKSRIVFVGLAFVASHFHTAKRALLHLWVLVVVVVAVAVCCLSITRQPHNDAD